ncbi:MAG: signal peptidase II [Thermoleophilaceae bacterium]|nr:signal peptidase II [Thermoleophilaceae bacterium]
MVDSTTTPAALAVPRHGERASRAHAWALAAIVGLAVAALDQATKALALASLTPGESIDVFPGIDLNLVQNTGIAFGALAGAGNGLILVVTVVALVALLAFFAARVTRPVLWLPVGMVLGGAAGNLIDRSRTGAVVDFIDPTFWPAFNLADTAIVLGVVGVLYVGERRSQPAGEPPEPRADAEGPGRETCRDSS